MRNFFLLAASYYFYMNWNASYALLLLTSTFITYVAAIRIEKVPSTKQKKAYLIASLVTNLSILFFFKYYNFAISTINEILFPLN
ncbi:MAG: MBOAT family protein, partial [Paraprevotella sp.]|nr:MBOAT family protein [Paraprevotella sp.]MDY5266698.1 MBOAT family protein [Bacteroidaceae bacterium]